MQVIVPKGGSDVVVWLSFSILVLALDVHIAVSQASLCDVLALSYYTKALVISLMVVSKAVGDLSFSRIDLANAMIST
jgi:hypothetical protein